MKKSTIMWLLGAGASVDSDLPTYRGPDGLYTEAEASQAMISPEKQREILNKINHCRSGPTYEEIKKISSSESFIITQNIDGFAINTGLKTIEIHKRENNDIVLLGEQLPKKKIHDTYRLIKQTSIDYVIIMGTSMQFPYLRIFIDKAKSKGARIIHINPDKEYKGHLREKIKIMSDEVYSSHKKAKNEIVLYMNCLDGLAHFTNHICNK